MRSAALCPLIHRRAHRFIRQTPPQTSRLKQQVGHLPMAERNDDLITLEAAAARMGLLAISLRDDVRRGYLLPERIDDGTCWFRPEAVDRYARTLGVPDWSPLRPDQ
jgi:hypothetical protein